jgi:hypothetical protein
LPTPRVVSAACGVTFRLFPVYRKAFAAAGRESKLTSDSLIAAYKLTVLMFRSWTKSDTEGETGSSDLVKWAAAAVHLDQHGIRVSMGMICAVFTIVEHHAWFAPLLAERGKGRSDGFGIRKVNT